MNNFTKTESLPKTGHVTEVCKEWLVREDSALAYKLQSQEINDFYKGNRQRNAVVREDFPTALNEQIKEKENAEKQAELYRRRLQEQEEYDKRIARDIAEKLERDLQEQQQRELHESEVIAQQMQEIYVNLPPPSRAGARANAARPPPPRPAKASIQQQNPIEPSTSNGRYHHQHSHTQSQQAQPQNHTQAHYQPQSQPIQLQQQHFSNTDCYVGLSVQPPIANATANSTAITTPTRQKQAQSNAPASTGQLLVSEAAAAAHMQSPINQFVERSKVGRSPHALTTDNLNIAQPQFTYHQHQHSLSSTSAGSTSSATMAPTAVLTTSSISNSSHSSIATSSATRRNVFESVSTSPQSPTNSQALYTPNSPTHTSMHNSSPNAITAVPQTHHDIEEIIEYSDVADSIRRYDISPDADADATDASPTKHQLPTATQHNTNFNRFLSPSHENLLRNDQHFQKLSPEKYDQLVGNDMVATAGAAAERHMQAHADDIELYADPCDYASLKEIGLPMEEIKEMSKKLKQEQKDELLARRLQEMEAGDGLTQEERDRLLAIEAQDKELAKMLQEREKAKAKRAKEKARLRKNQQKDPNAASSSLCFSSNGLHCGPLLPLPQDCMSFSKHSSSAATVSNVNAHAQTLQEDPVDVEAYSNPIDVINNQQQRVQNGTLTNGSLTRESTNSLRHDGSQQRNRDDDIYTLPVDSCRPGQRPASLNIGPDSAHLIQHNSMTRSENYSLESQDSLSGRDISPRMNYSKSGTFDQSSSPTPPYMPIQGTRRSNSSEDRKKKSKDKCTHQ